VPFCIIRQLGEPRVQKRTVWVPNCTRAPRGAMLMQKCTVIARWPAASPTQRS